MGQTNRSQDYPHSFKTVSASQQALCNRKAYFRMWPPEQLLQHKNLHTTIVLRFDAAIAAQNRVVKRIAIGNEMPLLVEWNPSQYKYLDINVAADADRFVKLSMDLSPLVLPDHDNWVIIELADALLNVSTVGTIFLWKIDELYTSTGIR